jgi:hypothetical protein
MKKQIYTLIMLAGIAMSVSAQQTVYYKYDDAGNRIKRSLSASKLLTVPDSSNNKTVEEEINTLILAFQQPEQMAGIESSSTGEIKVFPNPIEEKLNIQFSNVDYEVGYNIQLFDGSGKLFYIGQSNKEHSEIDMQNAGAGVYYLVVVTKEGKRNFWKMIKE